MSEFKVVNPATNETEREFATATDAEVGQVLERSARAYQSWRTTPPGTGGFSGRTSYRLA